VSLPRSQPPTTWDLGGAVITDHGLDVYTGLADENGKPISWHWCDGEANQREDFPGRWIGARCSLHTVVQVEPLTLSPSLLCNDCGWHGFLVDGVWRPC
jgi:hypothetical protein